MAIGWSFGALVAALKDAAFKDTGTTSGTVAAGDDSRIVNAVPNTRTVNSKRLDSNITLSATDVGALPISGGKLTGALEVSSGTIRMLDETYTNYAYGQTGTYSTTSLNFRWELYSAKVSNPSIRTNIITADVVDSDQGRTSSPWNNPTTNITLHGNVTSPGQFRPSDWTNFDARYHLS